MAPLMKAVFNSSLRHKQSVRVVLLMCLVLPFSLLIFYWCHTTNSLALTAFGYLTFFNVGSLVTSLVSIWASKQQPTSKFSFGHQQGIFHLFHHLREGNLKTWWAMPMICLWYHRVNVLAVFSITVLLMMFGINLIKHSMERVFEPPVVSTKNMFLGLVIGLGVHMTVSCGVHNLPLLHASEAASHNWLQRALSDFGHTVSSFSPSLGRILLAKLNPITLLVFVGAASLAVTQLLIDLDELYLADVTGALFIAALICGTMLPLSIYTAKILLQTAPQHILPLLDKSLREASTLDGVLGLKNEHFWTIAFGSYAGSLHVRVRRDANEQEVLAQLTSRLASQLTDLTIQVVKEDWTLASSPLAPSPTPAPTFNPITTATGLRGDPLPNPGSSSTAIAPLQRQKPAGLPTTQMHTGPHRVIPPAPHSQTQALSGRIALQMEGGHQGLGVGLSSEHKHYPSVGVATTQVV